MKIEDDITFLFLMLMLSSRTTRDKKKYQVKKSKNSLGNDEATHKKQALWSSLIHIIDKRNM